MSNYPSTNTQVQPAMAGLFSWLKKAVKVVGAVVSAFVPGPVGRAIHEFTDGDGRFFGMDIGNFFDAAEGFLGRLAAEIGDIPLTASEEALLDEWVSNSFIPYFKPYLAKVNTLKDGANTTLVTTVFNEVYMLIGFLQWYRLYSSKFGQTGYTENAIKSRNAFILFQIEVIRESLNVYLAENNLILNPFSTTIQSNPQDYSALGLELPVSFEFNAIKISDDDQEVITDNTDGNTATPKSRPLLWLGIAAVLIYSFNTNKNN